jgi:hypothetical protein
MMDAKIGNCSPNLSYASKLKRLLCKSRCALVPSLVSFAIVFLKAHQNQYQHLSFSADFVMRPYRAQLKSGTAEIFGTELCVDKTHSFVRRKFAIWTWHGCELIVEGNPTSAYISDETPMVRVVGTRFIRGIVMYLPFCLTTDVLSSLAICQVTYINCHSALETQRTAAAAAIASSAAMPVDPSAAAATGVISFKHNIHQYINPCLLDTFTILFWSVDYRLCFFFCSPRLRPPRNDCR